MTDLRAAYRQARSEVCALLKLDSDNLGAADTMRVNIATALKLALDDMQVKLLNGKSVDTGKLLDMSEAVTKLLPNQQITPKQFAVDPRETLYNEFLKHKEADRVEEQREVDVLRQRCRELEAENERLRGDRPKMLPGTKAIDGEIIPPPAPQPPQTKSAAETRAQMDRVNADQSAYERQGLRRAAHDEPWRPYGDGGPRNDPTTWPGGTRCRYDW